MIQELYIALSPALPIAALLISVVSLLVSMRNRADQKQAVLLEKNTELITKLAERQWKVHHLALIYIQKKTLLLKTFDVKADALELKRLDSCLTLALEEQLSVQGWLSRARKAPPPDLASLEKDLATANEALALVDGSLEHEQGTLAELKVGI